MKLVSKYRLLDQVAAAKLLNIAEKTLEQWRWKGVGPKFLKLSGRIVRYRASDLTDWLVSRERHSTCDKV